MNYGNYGSCCGFLWNLGHSPWFKGGRVKHDQHKTQVNDHVWIRENHLRQILFFKSDTLARGHYHPISSIISLSTQWALWQSSRGWWFPVINQALPSIFWGFRNHPSKTWLKIMVSLRCSQVKLEDSHCHNLFGAHWSCKNRWRLNHNQSLGHIVSTF